MKSNLSDPNGIVYIKTDQLDGETDLKPRMEVDMFRGLDVEDVVKYEVIFNVKKNNLNEFEGKIREIPANDLNESQEQLIINEREPTTLDDGKLMNLIKFKIHWCVHH